MLNRVELKKSALEKLSGNWGVGALISLIYVIILVGGAFIHRISGLIAIFVTPAILVGTYFAFLTLVQTGSIKLEDMFSGFGSHYLKSLGMYWWKVLWILLWSLLLVVPGVIKAIAYSQVYFIIRDHPEVKVRDAMKISMNMTQGYKWDLFVLGFSFVGWFLLTAVTLFIGLLWLFPYITATYAATYIKLKGLSLESGACTEDMFSGKQRLVTP